MIDETCVKLFAIRLCLKQLDSMADKESLSFSAVMLAGEKSGCRLVKVPFNVEEHFGRRGVVPVTNVEFSANGKTARSPGPLYPSGRSIQGKPREHILLLRTAIREQLGVVPGDTVSVKVPVKKMTKKAGSDVAAGGVRNATTLKLGGKRKRT